MSRSKPLAAKASIREGRPDPNKLPAQEYINQCTHIIAKENPKVAMRFVFRVSQLPFRPSEVDRCLRHFQNKYGVEVSICPQDIDPVVMPQDDIVLTMSGALDSVLDAAHELLERQAPKPRGFFMWQVCVLAPHQMHFLFIGEWDPKLKYDQDQDMAESSIPELHRVLGRRYGPDSTEEVLLTLESPRLDHIVDALRIIAATQKVYERACGPSEIKLYGGGNNNRIPAALSGHTEVFQGAAKMHPNVPVGYLIRNEMQPCQSLMGFRGFHLQLMLSSSMTQSLIGPRGVQIQEICRSTQAELCLSRNRHCRIRCCDIGANDHGRIIAAVVAIVRLLIDKGKTGWQLSVYVPQRVAKALEDSATKHELKSNKVRVDIQTLETAENCSRELERLQPSETEFVAALTSSDAIGLRRALMRILAIMYRD
ncbi:hypothetical protein CPC16_000080 [Podila verticillata]|nr:hypothetical protein CPC16_000080 [Podila verticillata]